MKAPRFTPDNCPHCEYDRQFPGFEAGGWMQQDNNGPIVSCPLCNDDGTFLPVTDEVPSAKGGFGSAERSVPSPL
jgi:hypothetical protein